MFRLAFVLPLCLAPAMLGAAKVELHPPDSAEVCGRCHRAIHDAWKSSAHAQSMESPLFQDVLELANEDFGAAGRKVCLGCHAPIAVLTGDLEPVKKVSWEGVTCDYCHSVRGVTMDGPNPKAQVSFANTKSGPFKDAVSQAHGTVFSEVHTTAEICAPCHEYRNANGFAVLTTYSEWKNSMYGKSGKPCQACHMYRVEGDVVDPMIQRVKHARINLHTMPGSHSLEQLNHAFKAQMEVTRDKDTVKVQVQVSNQAAGHYLPTGSPLRQLVMELRAEPYGGGRSFREVKTYARMVADAKGTVLMREHYAFLKATQVVSDTRLAPGEKRTENFSFPIPAGPKVQVKATFWYYFSPMARTESERRVTFLTLSRLLN